MQGQSQEGRIVAGTRQVLREISQGRARRVYLAKDAQERILSEVRSAAQKAGVPIEEISDMTTLGRRCRLQVACAAAVLSVTEG